jgi:hypothetical protein
MAEATTAIQQRAWGWFALLAALLAQVPAMAESSRGQPSPRLRLIIETDAGGDPDDEQSLVRFLLYCNEWDVEAIIANRPEAREGENKSPERTGLGIVRRFLSAYEVCYPKLKTHDSRYPTPAYLRERTVPGYEDTPDGVKRILVAVDSSDPRPVWFLNWGTDHGSASSSLTRALDQVRQERGEAGYAKFKNRLRLSSWNVFGEHTTTLQPPFPVWVDTFRPELEGKRWYHQFSAIAGSVPNFNLERDVRTGHGPLGALYPTNTTHPMKEGDTPTFLYLVPTGMNDPEQPTWGSWAGRYGQNDELPGKPYFWANQKDAWNGTTDRNNTLKRWAEHLQNDFRARLDWCVRDFAEANHPPAPLLRGELARTAAPGDVVRLDASGTTDPDRQALTYEWQFYPEAGSYQGELPEIRGAKTPQASFVAPKVERAQTLHVLLTVTDSGEPPLTRYRRVIVTVAPKRGAAK